MNGVNFGKSDPDRPEADALFISCTAIRAVDVVERIEQAEEVTAVLVPVSGGGLIAGAIRHVYWNERQIVEGCGSVGVPVLLSRKVSPSGPRAVLLSGGDIDMKLHHRIISGKDVDVTGVH